MRGIFIYHTAVSKSACLFPVSCENKYSAYIVNPPLYKLWSRRIQSQTAALQFRGNLSEDSRELFVVFPPRVLLHTVYIFNIFSVD
jgi:hypothetical protein